ncbi:hypothetical protein BPNPMPFG_000898 [Mesorhizobium sp. AR07]|uniref:hypothetical protein n=1 Tax=Mesorhizobium sp. AR07 TaxID=2865838 RepID=UPI0021610105|nr:hypothetical protein [Mesorhizobium sp. AR07]UVK45368.1 hypothetical protein BPNPMPFG_000898 [Mesorhizobium sp. AR07]
MAQITTPLAGGSYIRNKDGSLKQVAGTEPAAAPAAAVEAAVVSAQTTEASEVVTDPSKKGK